MNKKKNKSALQEKKGVENSHHINKSFEKKKRKEIPVSQYVSEILESNHIFLSKAITLLESNRPEFFNKGQEILNRLLPYTGRSERIGITGVPGVGKSTFIEQLGKYYTRQGHKVAVLAIDPSSSVSKGSILGDKTRMEELVRDKNAFIRPTPAGNILGGVARKTRETIFLCEAAGFDKILIETVGVGQSETLVHSMTDFFLLLKLAGAGDELQGIKRGIIEMADLIVINKAEKENLNAAKLAQKSFQTALHYFPPKESKWMPKVMLASALQKKGIKEIALEIEKYFNLTKANGFFNQKRSKQNQYWFYDTIEQKLKIMFYQNPEIKSQLPNFLQEIEELKISPFDAAEKLISIYQSKNEK